MTLGSKIKKGLLAGGAGLAALAAVNAGIARGRDKQPETLQPAEEFAGERHIYTWSAADIFYRVAGNPSAPALVLIHDISPGASHLMWRRNFNLLAGDFQVYAFDLPGFGASAKPPLAPYSADFYVAAILAFLRDTVRRPAHLIASSLGAAFAIRVADEHSEAVRKLILLAPLIASLSPPGMTGAAFYGLLHSPVLGTSFYNAVASERSLRDHLRKHLFYDKRFVTNDLVAHLYRLSHQPGAQYAIRALLSGYLNTDVSEAFARLRQPVTVVWGAEDRTTAKADKRNLARLNPRVELILFAESRAWLQEERAQAFNELVSETFLDENYRRAASA